MNIERACLLFILSLLPLLCLPWHLLWLGGLFAFIMLLLALYKQHKLLLVCACLIGISYARIMVIAEQANQQPVQHVFDTIRVTQLLKQVEDYQSAVAIRENGVRVYLVWRSETPLFLGGVYRAELPLKPLSSRLNVGNFNRQRWFLANHIQATATVKRAELLTIPEQDFRLNRFYRVKDQLSETHSLGIILALAFGERAWLANEDWRLFQRTSTAHLIAISGLHITLAFGIGFWLGKGVVGFINGISITLLRRQAVENSHFFALFVGFLGACIYSFLAGFSFPTTRALVAISLLLIWRLSRHYYPPWQLWLQCVSGLLFIDPITLLSESFWLSALAVLGLIFWYRFFPFSSFEWGNRYPKWLSIMRLVHLQMGILFCFLPVQLYFFEGHNPWAFVVNLLIVPLYSLLIVPIILFTLLSNNIFHSWEWVDRLIQWSLICLRLFEEGWQPLSLEQQWRLLSLDLFVLSLLYWRKQLKTHFSLLVVVSLAWYQSYFWWRDWQSKPLVEWIHFDVGQGLAMAFVYEEQGQRKAILYDTGASWQQGSMAELEIIPYLKRQAILPEVIILSHDDNDHSGGILPLLAHYPQAKLILSGENRYSNMPFEACVRGREWEFGKLSLRVYFPEKLALRANNADSCVLVVKISTFRLLLTGDSGITQEQKFASEVGKIDFLQVGHHGSKTSTSYTLLAGTKPEYAFISSGRFNYWQMPHSTVLERLAKFNIQTLNTAREGMISVKFYDDYYQIETHRSYFSPWYQYYLGK